MYSSRVFGVVFLCAVATLVAPRAHAQHPAEEPHETGTPPNTHSLATIGAKLNDPTSDVWALQFEFERSGSET